MIHAKIYGQKKHFDGIRNKISNAIHRAVTLTMNSTIVRRHHWFFPMEPYDSLHTEDDRERQLLIEILMPEGNSDTVRKQLIEQIYANLERTFSFDPETIDIVIQEYPLQNWGIRGRVPEAATVVRMVDA